MMRGLFSDPSVRAARIALTSLSQRQQQIANNIANIDTPGYLAREVKFEDALNAELVKARQVGGEAPRLPLSLTQARHLPANEARKDVARVRVELASDSTLRNDENTVDVDRQMSLLAETQIAFNTVAQYTTHKFGMLRTAINEGRR